LAIGATATRKNGGFVVLKASFGSNSSHIDPSCPRFEIQIKEVWRQSFSAFLVEAAREGNCLDSKTKKELPASFEPGVLEYRLTL
jgi:hypothetical protein